MRWLRQFSVDASRAAREQWLSMYHARIAHICRHRGTAPPTGVVTAAQWSQPSRAPEGHAAPPRASAAARHGALCPTQVEEPRKTRGRRRAQGADAAEHQEERRRSRVPASSRPPEGPRLLHSWRLDRARREQACTLAGPAAVSDPAQGTRNGARALRARRARLRARATTGSALTRRARVVAPVVRPPSLCLSALRGRTFPTALELPGPWRPPF